jgi:phosphoribosylformylglycinamidine synthase
MATRIGKETVKSPRELVISFYAAMEDIRRKVTPDIKQSEKSVLVFIPLGGGKSRLGGSAFAQTLKQIGNESPDMDDPMLVKRAFEAVQQLIEEGLILAGHDVSDGGLVTAILEMAFAGNCGFNVGIVHGDTPIEGLFAEELGLVIEVDAGDANEICLGLASQDIPCRVIGVTTLQKRVIIRHKGTVVLDEPMQLLRSWWEETSYQLERLQSDPECADEEKRNIEDRKGPTYALPFSVHPTAPGILVSTRKPKVAILREEGSNSDREMTAAFHAAGFDPWDIAMTDLLDGRITLDGFRGLAAVGGFSYADVPESAKGWAATILFHEKLKKMFDAFYDRPDTFSLGICNGAQLFGLLGWVPWRGLPAERQPRFVHNRSGRFESRWATVKVRKSPAMMLRGMEGLVFGIHVDHGEGLLHFPDLSVRECVLTENLAAVVYVDDEGNPTRKYPFNPSGTPLGITGVSSRDGRHFAMMPHPERCILPWQCHWLPEDLKWELTVTPWLRMFQNAREWCEGN